MKSSNTSRRQFLRAAGITTASVALARAASAEDTAVPSTPPAEPLPGLATAITRRAGLEARIMWMDATANLQRLSTPAGVSAVFEKCQQANINTVVVDVKPLSGHVLFESKVAPKLKEWKGFQYPEGYDLLATCIEEGKRRGIKVYASINTFCEGHKLLKRGPLYEKRELQAIVYDVERTVTAADGSTWTLISGQGHPPADGEISAFGPGASKALRPDEAAVLVDENGVSAVVDGALTELGSVAAPDGGHMLVGRGAGAKWLLEHLAAGQLLKYTAKERLDPILDAPSEAVGGFVNPVSPESRAYALKLVEELASNYAVDGLIFDRMRYSSLRTDFSPLSREQFEAWLGKKLDRFPQDIYAYDPLPGRPMIQGPYFKQWLHWRARNIHDWLEQAAQTAKSKRPGINLGVYVGSWYPVYYEVGVNWGADDYKPGLDWMTPNYAETGYAGMLTWLTTGCYYPIASRETARQLGVLEDNTVEAAAETSLRAVNDAAFVYAGIQVLDYQGKPDDFKQALQMAVQSSQGVMLFDLVYVEEYNWWNILNEAFSAPRKAPHDVPGLQEALRQAKQALRAATPAPKG